MFGFGKSSASELKSEGWVEEEPPGWAEKVAKFPQSRLEDGARVRLRGECPRCGHRIDIDLAIELRAGARVPSDIEKPLTLGRRQRFMKVASCNCGHPHEGRPEVVSRGCGAFGALLVG